VGLVDDDVDALEVDLQADGVQRAAEDDDQLVERAAARGAHRPVQQRAAAVGQQLLGPAQARRVAGGQDQAGDERLSGVHGTSARP